MAEYILSVAADRDLEEIYIYSYNNFGETKADAYLSGLEECLQRLAESPRTGRKADHIRKAYMRYEYVSHSIFYKTQDKNILVVRVLHNSRDVIRHLN